MKGDTATCKYCGTAFVKKRGHQKFCKTSHRVNYHQSTKGKSKAISTISGTVVIPPPAKVKEFKPQPQLRTLPPVQKVRQNFKSVSNTDSERKLLAAKRAYWVNIYNNSFTGTANGLAVVGAGMGYLYARDKEEKCSRSRSCETSPSDTLTSVLIGAGIGYVLQGMSSTPEDTRKCAAIEIRKIDNAIKELAVVQSQIKTLQVPIKKGAFLKKPASVTSSREYRSAHIETLTIPGKWKYLFGEPSPGFLLLLSGASGNGKTTMAVQLASDLHNSVKPVIYATYEQQGKNKQFQTLMNQQNAQFDVSEYPPRDIASLAALAAPYGFLVIDSINYAGFSAQEIEQLRDSCPGLSIIGIMQNTKDGKYKGDAQFLHNSDVHIEAISGKAIKRKSRYLSQAGDLEIW